MKAALIGMVQSGKSTLMSVMSGKDVPPMGSTKIVEAVVPVPDERLDWLDGFYQPKKKVNATVDCLDMPGFSFTDDGSRTTARRQLDEIRTADMLVLVIRGFENPTVAPYRGRIDPKSDLAELMTELLLADLEIVMNRISRLEVQVMRATKTLEQDKRELKLQLRLQEALESERPIRNVIESEEEEAFVKSIGFYTQKPLSVVFNLSDESPDALPDVTGVLDESIPVMGLNAKLELELAGLDEESRAEFMADLGIAEPGAHRFVNNCYEAMGLISFLTVGKDEVRAWPVRRGISALDAAGKIHSDIKRGFIRAETMSYEVLRELGDEKAVKAAGKSRLEGKTYIVQDGDIINFRFNV